MHVNDLPPFHERVPYVAAIVELEEGPRVMTNVEGVPFDELRADLPVMVDFRAISDDVTYRAARPHDAEGIARLHADSWRRNYRGAFSELKTQSEGVRQAHEHLDGYFGAR